MEGSQLATDPDSLALRLADLKSDVIQCEDCPRLVSHRESIARIKKRQFLGWDYWGRPVPGFGDIAAVILIVGLAPAPHGGNRTGRVFTGDRSADFLVRGLFEAGYANQGQSVDMNDGLKLHGVYMTAAVKCVPPDNKPTSQEILTCSKYLESELRILEKARIILCLGSVAYQTIMTLLRKNGLFQSKSPKFEHGLELNLTDGRTVLASYHPSPRNTQTGILTAQMFNSLLRRARSLAG